MRLSLTSVDLPRSQGQAPAEPVPENRELVRGQAPAEPPRLYPHLLLFETATIHPISEKYLTERAFG